MGFFHNMKYIDYSKNNPRCIHCFINERAYASVITEVMTNGQKETGGVFLGYIVNRAWYIVESVDPGLETINQVSFFQWDTKYVNHQAERLSKIYIKPLTVLGFWHRHPGSMDYFSGQDETTILSNLKELPAGLLSMLVNIDPKLRMTYYYCYGKEIMPIRYDVGNKYFPVELMKYADAAELSQRAYKNGKSLDIHYEQVINLDEVSARKKFLSNNKKESTEIRTETISSNSNTGKNRGTDRTPISYSDEVSDATIKRIAEIVVGIEGDTNSRIESLSEKVCLLEKTNLLLIKKADEILAKVNSPEVKEPHETITTALVEKKAQIPAENSVEKISEEKISEATESDVEESESLSKMEKVAAESDIIQNSFMEPKETIVPDMSDNKENTSLSED